jgi:predicted alternative tryptophan synthase beta-subunit
MLVVYMVEVTILPEGILSIIGSVLWMVTIHDRICALDASKKMDTSKKEHDVVSAAQPATGSFL